MRAQYLLRFDDICPTMNWRVWNEVEAILQEEKVRPIVAVVPDNQHELLRVGAAEPFFWDRVRGWQRRGWAVAMHGWQHRFVTKDAGLLGINKYSELAGLPREEQERKLRSGKAVFEREGIDPGMFVAPAHSFDEVTLQLLSDLGFRSLSDGFFPFPHRDRFGMLWIPQQLWSFRRRPLGIWTICFHINHWRPEDIAHFRTKIRDYREVISDVRAVAAEYGMRRRSPLDCVAARAYRTVAAGVSRAKSVLQQVSV